MRGVRVAQQSAGRPTALYKARVLKLGTPVVYNPYHPLAKLAVSKS